MVPKWLTEINHSDIAAVTCMGVGCVVGHTVGIDLRIVTVVSGIFGAVTKAFVSISETLTHHANEYVDVLQDDAGSVQRWRSRQRGDARAVDSPLSRLNSQQLEKLEAMMLERRDVGDITLQSYCEALVQLNLESELFAQENWLVFAFMGYKKGLLSSSQLAAAAHLDLFLHHYSDQKERIGSLDCSEDRMAFNNSFKKLRYSTVDRIDFSSLSPLDKMLLFVPVEHSRTRNDTLFDVFARTPGTVLTNHQKEEFIIVSPSVIQEAIYEVAPDHAITVFPTFGYSNSMKDFLGQPHLRVLGIDCRYFSQGSVHDFEPCSPFDMYHHDVAFHSVLSSFDPYRSLEDQLAQFFWDYYRKLKSKHTFLKQAAIFFADRPFLYPNAARSLDMFFGDTNEEAFLHSLLLGAKNSGDENYFAYCCLIKSFFNQSSLPFPVKSISKNFVELLLHDKNLMFSLNYLVSEFNIKIK